MPTTPSRLAILVASLLVSCRSPERSIPSPSTEPVVPSQSVDSSTHEFHRSPGGTFEIAPEQVAAWRRNASDEASVRIVDVREPEELTDEFGHIPGVEQVSLGNLTQVAEGWDPDRPVVLVCRTGRRSARGVDQLEALGLRRVASMTGGMLRWKELGLPVSHAADDIVSIAPNGSEGGAAEVAVRGAPNAPPLRIEPTDVRWIRTATLLSSGSESCVDGRDPHAVVGTPGGDAGELIVSLATVESFGSEPLEGSALELLVDEWIETFGRFYMHSDEHALEHLREAVLDDPRFASRGIAPRDVHEMENIVRHPPAGLEDALLERLIEPSNVGCGHLRSMLIDPEDFLVRKELPSDLLRAVFRHMWRAPEDVEWVVLEGEHEERAVVIVSLDREVHAYTKVPAVPPSLDGRQAFVAHPQVTAYLREENASFLLERSPALAHRVHRGDFVRRMRRIADVQLEATLSRLANGLPVYEARFGAPGSAPVTVSR